MKVLMNYIEMNIIPAALIFILFVIGKEGFYRHLHCDNLLLYFVSCRIYKVFASLIILTKRHIDDPFCCILYRNYGAEKIIR